MAHWAKIRPIWSPWSKAPIFFANFFGENTLKNRGAGPKSISSCTQNNASLADPEIHFFEILALTFFSLRPIALMTF
jgi:hypothetical protein